MRCADVLPWQDELGEQAAIPGMLRSSWRTNSNPDLQTLTALSLGGAGIEPRQVDARERAAVPGMPQLFDSNSDQDVQTLIGL